MRLRFLPVVVGAFATLAVPASAEDMKAFRLKIGDTTVEINAGESVDVTLPGGQKTTVVLNRNPFVSYSSEAFSFVLPGDMSVAKTKLNDSVTQHLAASARGTVVLLQEYKGVNPASLTQLMLQELTKKSAKAGADITQASSSRKLADGKVMNGLTAKAKTPSGVTEYEVEAYGTNDRGIIAITVIEEARMASEGDILKRFWESLAIKA